VLLEPLAQLVLRDQQVLQVTQGLAVLLGQLVIQEVLGQQVQLVLLGSKVLQALQQLEQQVLRDQQDHKVLPDLVALTVVQAPPDQLVLPDSKGPLEQVG
jgi:hypothetical protein